MTFRHHLPVVAALLLAAVPSVPAQAKVAERGYWRATSKTAQSITGDISIGEEKLTIYFAPFTIAEIRALTSEEVAAVFNTAADSGPTGNLYRLNVPASRRFLHKNNLCGTEDTQWMAVSVEGKTLQLAFLSGSAMPVFKPEVLMNSTALCGTYMYSR